MLKRTLAVVLMVFVLATLACGGATGGTPTATPMVIPRTFRGTGDDIIECGDLSRYTKARLTHSGKANFIVVPYDGNNNRLSSLVNEIGQYKGTVKWEPKARSVEVNADGDWEIVVSR